MTLLGGGGLAWILKFQREDAGKAVEQVHDAMDILRSVNDDLKRAYDRAVDERDMALMELDICKEARGQLLARLQRLEGYGN